MSIHKDGQIVTDDDTVLHLMHLVRWLLYWLTAFFSFWIGIIFEAHGFRYGIGISLIVAWVLIGIGIKFDLPDKLIRWKMRYEFDYNGDGWYRDIWGR